ncbi:MAG: hypothetical protein GX921_05820 [Bacteroidales bacterium]|nr:hypothetical protein [Bacteroidales bacterium]
MQEEKVQSVKPPTTQTLLLSPRRDSVKRELHTSQKRDFIDGLISTIALQGN